MRTIGVISDTHLSGEGGRGTAVRLPGGSPPEGIAGLPAIS